MAPMMMSGRRRRRSSSLALRASRQLRPRAELVEPLEARLGGRRRPRESAGWLRETSSPNNSSISGKASLDKSIFLLSILSLLQLAGPASCLDGVPIRTFLERRPVQQQPQQQQQQPPHHQGSRIHFNVTSLSQHAGNQSLASLGQQLAVGQLHRTGGAYRWPLISKVSSSSSPIAENEDLQDSSIKTKLGNLSRPVEVAQQPAPMSPSNAIDFDRLMEQILQQIELKQNQREQLQYPMPTNPKVAADANNKTTMRFFRNNKTFASIVYTNSQEATQQLDPNGAGLVSVSQPRRLINCHLVDLEKHSSDVALFESKYDIKTFDIEFKEMMQLIDHCTNIARFKPLRPFQSSLKPNVAQLFAASLPDSTRISALHSGQQVGQQPQQPMPSKQQSSSHPIRPFLVVGRPATQQQQQRPPAPQPIAANSISTFQSVMSGALNQELQKLPPIQEEPGRLELPRAIQRRSFASGQRSLLDPQAAAAHHQIASNLLAKAAETGKKLVLGEVTPSPAAVDARQGGIKEALQEITSYDTTDLLAIWRGILPGTNWCGMGDRATSYNDLGFESDIDICCRAHDFCPIRLSAFSAGYGLFNWSFYTRSHCWCDQNFLDCLQRAQSPLSAVVMRFYFTIMKTTCLHDNETSIATSSLATYQQQLPQSQSRQHVYPSELTQAGSQQQQRLLLDQIRAAMPIPALRQSQVVQSKVEAKMFS